MVRELSITEGWNVLDDNLLACSEQHIRAVFAMLKRQPHSAEFTGGLEAARLEWWMAQEFRRLNPKQLFFAYDTPDDFGPLSEASEMLQDAGFQPRSHTLRCFVLCGWPKDTQEAAARRLREALTLGFTPMAMLYRGQDGKVDPDWAHFQRRWARPAIIHARPVPQFQMDLSGELT